MSDEDEITKWKLIAAELQKNVNELDSYCNELEATLQRKKVETDDTVKEMKRVKAESDKYRKELVEAESNADFYERETKRLRETNLHQETSLKEMENLLSSRDMTIAKLKEEIRSLQFQNKLQEDNGKVAQAEIESFKLRNTQLLSEIKQLRMTHELDAEMHARHVMKLSDTVISLKDEVANVEKIRNTQSGTRRSTTPLRTFSSPSLK
eukprot:PhF_6_TR11290/c0_g1_i1/m.18221